MVATKRIHEPIQDSACGRQAPGSQCAHERTPPTASEDDELSSGLAQIDEVVAGIALPRFGQCSIAHRSHEMRVTAGAGRHNGKAHPRIFSSGSESPPRRRCTRNDTSQSAWCERELSSVHDRQAGRAGCHGRLNRRVHAVDVENREGIEPEVRSFLHHTRGLVGPVKKREGAVRVQFCVASFRGHPAII